MSRTGQSTCKDQGVTRQDPNLGTRTPAPSTFPCGKGRPSCINHQTHTSPHLGKRANHSQLEGRNATTRTGAQQISESLYKTQNRRLLPPVFPSCHPQRTNQSLPTTTQWLATMINPASLRRRRSRTISLLVSFFFSFLPSAHFPWLSLSHILSRAKTKAGDS